MIAPVNENENYNFDLVRRIFDYFPTLIKQAEVCKKNFENDVESIKKSVYKEKNISEKEVTDEVFEEILNRANESQSKKQFENVINAIKSTVNFTNFLEANMSRIKKEDFDNDEFWRTNNFSNENKVVIKNIISECSKLQIALDAKRFKNEMLGLFKFVFLNDFEIFLDSLYENVKNEQVVEQSDAYKKMQTSLSDYKTILNAIESLQESNGLLSNVNKLYDEFSNEKEQYEIVKFELEVRKKIATNLNKNGINKNKEDFIKKIWELKKNSPKDIFMALKVISARKKIYSGAIKENKDNEFYVSFDIPKSFIIIVENIVYFDVNIGIENKNLGYSHPDGSCLIHSLLAFLPQEIVDAIVDYAIRNNILCPAIRDYFVTDGQTTIVDIVIKHRINIEMGENKNLVICVRAAIARKMIEMNNNSVNGIENELLDVLGITNSGYIEASYIIFNAIAELTGYSVAVLFQREKYGTTTERFCYSLPNGNTYKKNIMQYSVSGANELELQHVSRRCRCDTYFFIQEIIDSLRNDSGNYAVLSGEKVILIRGFINHYVPVQSNNFKGQLTEGTFKQISFPEKQKKLAYYYLNVQGNENVYGTVRVNELFKRANMSIFSLKERENYFSYLVLNDPLISNYFKLSLRTEVQKKIDEFQTNLNNKLNEMKKNVEKELNGLIDNFQKNVFQTPEERNSYIDDARDNSVKKILLIDFFGYNTIKKIKINFYENNIEDENNIDYENEFNKYKSVVDLNSKITFNELTNKFANEYEQLTKMLDEFKLNEFKLELQKLKDIETTTKNVEFEKLAKENYTNSKSKIKTICNKMKRAPEIKIYNSKLIHQNTQSTGISSFFLSLLSYITPEEFNALRIYVDEKNRAVKIHNVQRTVLNWLHDSAENLSAPENYLRAHIVLKCLEIFPNDNERDKNLNNNLRIILGYEKNKNIDWTNFAFFKLISQTLEKPILIVSPGTDKDKSGYCCVKSEDKKIELEEGVKKLSDLSQDEVKSTNEKINAILKNSAKKECICIYCSNGNNFAPIGFDTDIDKFDMMILYTEKNIRLRVNNFLYNFGEKFPKDFFENNDIRLLRTIALLGEILTKKEIENLKLYFIDNDNFLQEKFKKFIICIHPNNCNFFKESHFLIFVLANSFNNNLSYSSTQKLFQIEPIEKFLPSDMYDEFLNNFLKIDKVSQEKIINLLVDYKENIQYVLPLVYDLINNKSDESIYKNSVNLLKKKENFNFYILNRKSIEEKNYKLISRLGIDENLKSDFIKKIHFFSLEELNFLEKIILNSGQNATTLLKLSIKGFRDVTKKIEEWKNFLQRNRFSKRQIINMANKFICEKLNAKNFNAKNLLTEINMMQKNYFLISSKDKRDYCSNSSKYVKNFQKKFEELKGLFQNSFTNLEKILNVYNDKNFIDKCVMFLKSQGNITWAKIFKSVFEVKKILSKVRRRDREVVRNFFANVINNSLCYESFNYDGFKSYVCVFMKEYSKNPSVFLNKIVNLRKALLDNKSSISFNEYFDGYDAEEQCNLLYLCSEFLPKSKSESVFSKIDKSMKNMEEEKPPLKSLRANLTQINN